MRFYRIFILFLSFLYCLNADTSEILAIESSLKSANTASLENINKEDSIESNENYNNSIEYLINLIVKTNHYLREIYNDRTNEIFKNKIDSKYLANVENLSKEFEEIEFDEIKDKKYITKSEFENIKQVILESIPKNIVKHDKVFIFNTQQNLQDSKRLESKIAESGILHDNYENMLSQIKLNSLKAQKIFFETLIKARKQIDFFSTQSKVGEILSPADKSIKELPTSFNLPNDLVGEKKRIIESNLSDYLNELASYAEIISYLEMRPEELLPQNAMLNFTMHWILQKIASIIPIDYSNIMVAKIIVSLFIFAILWAFRTFIAKFIIYLMDFIVHISKQEKELHKEIQKGILKPISLLLLAWSINVSIGILYYPSIEPEGVEKWFDIFYVINIAWLFIAIIKSYGAAFISTLAQKSDGFRREIINLIIKILYSIVGIIAILTILHKMGFNVSAIIASLGLGGLAVALAVKDMLANFFASVMLLLDNAFSQGDWIVCGSVEGNVVEIGLRKTTIRTFDNALLFVPNSELAGKAIRNWSRRKEGRRIRLDIGLDYCTNTTAIKTCVEKITAMLMAHNEIVTDSNKTTPLDKDLSVRQDIISINDYLGYKSGMFIRIHNLDDSSVRLLLECYTKQVGKADFLRVQEDVIFKTMDIIRSLNIKFSNETQFIDIVKES